MERTKDMETTVTDKMLRFYQIEDGSKGTFLLQVDWLLENAVYPSESGYADNLMDLWNVYMPGYKFDEIVLEYSKKVFPVLRFVHEGDTSKFNSTKILQECAIKNYVKYNVSQGQTNRMSLVRECFDLLKDVTDRTMLYDIINKTIEAYFIGDKIEQHAFMFLKRFQDYTNQPYSKMVERLSEIQEHKEQISNARSNLVKSLKAAEKEEEILTLINIMLCRIALADGERRFSDVLKETWNKTVNGIPYTDKIYDFIEKYEKAYMGAACYGIKNIKKGEFIKQLYKDAIILCAALQAIETGNRCSINDVYKFWRHNGMHFAKRCFFEDEFERMKDGFHPEILSKYKNAITTFHDTLIDKISTLPSSSISYGGAAHKARNSASEMNHVALNEKDRQISELQERISELEEKVNNTEKEMLSQFISLLDSRKYDHVLGKLYRIAYIDSDMKTENIQRILQNLFEIMNISGIDVFGEVENEVNSEDIRKGKYRVDHEITKHAKVMYPGYRVGNSVVLHPLAEEV